MEIAPSLRMTYTICYDERVQDDVANIPRGLRIRIKEAIDQKLAERPEQFGKPLRHSLLGFRSLRVGDYRVVYLIRNKQVFVALIAHRKHAYPLAERRVSS